MIERQGQPGDFADGQLSVHHPRLVDDAAYAKHGNFGTVDDRRGAVDAEHPIVVQRERAAGQVSRGCLAVAGGGGEPADLRIELSDT